MATRTKPGVWIIGASLLLSAAVAARANIGPDSPPPLEPAAAPEAYSEPEGAQAVGKEVCATCHADVAAQYARSAHGWFPEDNQPDKLVACESCHGPGSAHVESGDAKDIRRFAKVNASDASRPCLSCHQAEHAREWATSEHATNDVGCTNCHRIHQSREVAPRIARGDASAPHATAPAALHSLVKPEPELCFSCHKKLRAKFSSSSHHPVREGRMTCSSCHDTHGSPGEHLLRTAERTNDLCATCHSAKQGPFMFEHAPVEESCVTCHDPHGTVANNLLKQGEPFLCLQCHEMHFHNARISPTSPVNLSAGGSTNPNGAAGFQRAFGTRCTTCHARIHGSDTPSQGISGGGKAFIR